MITRPLDLSTRLRRQPSGYEFIFYVNAGLIALFFVLFGSRFVLSPGLGLDFALPVMPASLAGSISTDVVVAIKGPNLAFVEGRKVDFVGLRSHLSGLAQKGTDMRLLVQADASLTTRDLTEVYDMARLAGFASVLIAAEPGAAKF
jgi:biopolymer transport protein ExbD